MKKNTLIQKLQKIEGNPDIYINDTNGISLVLKELDELWNVERGDFIMLNHEEIVERDKDINLDGSPKN